MTLARLIPVVVFGLDGLPMPTAWTAALWLRARRMFVTKLVGTTLWTWVFFVGYFHLLRFPNGAVTIVPLTVIDRLVPFQPAALIPYLSLWIYVGIAPGLQPRFVPLLVYGLWTGLLLATGLALFWLWPTAVPPGVFDPQGFPGFELMRGIDAAGNACPSMHVAIAVYSAIWVHVQLRQIGVPAALQIANLAWCAAITYSTLALKQHVLIDVVAGAALGGLFAAASLRWRPREADEGSPA